jgi:hypothetical protein
MKIPRFWKIRGKKNDFSSSVYQGKRNSIEVPNFGLLKHSLRDCTASFTSSKCCGKHRKLAKGSLKIYEWHALISFRGILAVNFRPFRIDLEPQKLQFPINISHLLHTTSYNASAASHHNTTPLLQSFTMIHKLSPYWYPGDMQAQLDIVTGMLFSHTGSTARKIFSTVTSWHTF